MAKWMRTLNIVDIWTQAYEQAESCDDVLYEPIVKVIAERLGKLDDFLGFTINQEKKTLINQFNNFSGDEDDFNELMNDLYSWGDISLGNGKKVCWIKTF